MINFKERGLGRVGALALGVGVALVATGASYSNTEAKRALPKPCLEYGDTTRLDTSELWLGQSEVLIVDLRKGSQAVVNGEVVKGRGFTHTLAVVDNPRCAENYAFPLVGKAIVHTYADGMTASGAIADEVSIILDRNHSATFDVVYADQGIIPVPSK